MFSNFFPDNIFVQFGGRIFQQTVGRKYAPLLADQFLHTYEADFIADLIQKKMYLLAVSLNPTFRYVDAWRSIVKQS